MGPAFAGTMLGVMKIFTVPLSAPRFPVRHHGVVKKIQESEMADPVQIVTPHLVVNDANAAIEFYKKALGATEALRMPAQDGKRLMHSEIRVGGARIFVMDDFPEHRGSHGVDAVFPPDQIKGTSVTMHLEVENCDAAVKRAADAGATVTMAPWDAFWGARYARIMDPFGHSWSFAHLLPAKG
jgi:PhnB protein